MEKKGLIGLLVLAILAATIGVAADAGASAPRGNAAASAKAKKKCKKRHGSKRKCKKRDRKTEAPRTPVVRATLTWFNGGANDVDVDLFAFDSNGGIAGNGAGPAGSETFTDGLFTRQSSRDLSFGVCYQVGGSVHTQFTLTYVTADGVVHGDSQNPGSSFQYDYFGGAPIPGGYCRMI
jgi:hypothetical protein